MWLATSLLVYCGTFEKFWSFIRIKEITNRGGSGGAWRLENTYCMTAKNELLHGG